MNRIEAYNKLLSECDTLVKEFDEIYSKAFKECDECPEYFYLGSRINKIEDLVRHIKSLSMQK